MSARDTASAEIKQLHHEQTELISIIIKGDISTKEKICRLAEVMERRYELGDFAFAISEISKEITRILRQYGCKLAPHVPDYLPDKYKDPELMAAARLAEHQGNAERGDVIEQLSIIEHRIPLLQSGIKQEMYDLVCNLKNIIETDAMNNDYQLSKRLYKKVSTEYPSDPKKTEYYYALERQRDAFAENVTTVEAMMKKAYLFPPLQEIAQTLAQWEDKFTGLLNVVNNWRQPYKDEKYAFAYPSWNEIQQFNKDHGKHAAATSEDAGRIKCVKYANDTRPLTREQVGDRASYLYKNLKETFLSIDNLRFMLTEDEYWHRPNVAPHIADRRKDLSPKLSDLA